MSYRFLSLSESISSLDRELRRVKSSAMKELGLKSSHTLVLYLLYLEPDGDSFTSLAKKSNCDAGMLSRTLHELRDLSLVQKEGDDSKYKQMYTLSEQGMEYGKKIAALVEDAEKKVRSSLNEQELEIFYKVAGQITDNLSSLPGTWRNNNGRQDRHGFRIRHDEN